VHLAGAQPVLVQDDGRLDLGVVVRVVGGEQADRGAVERLEAEVVSVTRRPTMRDTLQASTRMPTRRARDER